MGDGFKSYKIISRNFTDGVWSVVEDDVGESALPKGAVVQAVLVSVAALVGLAGNTTIAYLMATSPHLRSVTNLYLLNRAIAEVLVQLLIPLSVHLLFAENYVFGSVMCTIGSILLHVGLLTSALSLTALSIDCYLSSRPKHHSLTYRQKMLKIATAVIWLAGGVAGIVAFTSSRSHPYDSREVCVEGPLFSRNGIKTLHSIWVVFVVPLVTIWVYVSLTFPVKKATSATVMKEEEAASRTVCQSRRLLVRLAIAFTVCQLPYWLCQAVLVLAAINIVLPIVFLLHVNIAVNVILYFKYNSGFLQELAACVPCHSRPRVCPDTV